MKPLCIYHGNCADGFTSAWAVYKALGNDAEYFPGIYSEPPPDVTGRDVIMVDFSYKRPVLEKMGESANSILILDHHKTALEDLEPFTKYPVDTSVREEWAPTFLPSQYVCRAVSISHPRSRPSQRSRIAAAASAHRVFGWP